MDQIALVSFAKNPRNENYKTRLFADIQCTERVKKTYELLLKITNETLHHSMQLPDVKSYWAINSNLEDLPNYFSDQIELIQQGSGTLGDRLHEVYSKLKRTHKKVIIIGSDLPFLRKELIAETIAKLNGFKTVIGPSHDGGFYLFSSQEDFNSTFWTKVTYSQTDTLKQLVRPLKTSSISFLDNLTDIDDLESFTMAVDRLKRNFGTLDPLQKKLVHFFDEEILTNTSANLPANTPTALSAV